MPLPEGSVVTIEKVDWPDTSLGVPDPGRLYAPVITPGYRIVLRVGDESYELHTDLEGKNTVLAPK
jgi:hypothetical protein